MLRRSLRAVTCSQRLSQSFKAKLHTNAAQVMLCPHDKDFPSPHLPTPVSKLYSHDPDILLEKIRKAKSVEKVLELTDMHLSVMNSKHIVACLDNINYLAKLDNSTVDCKALLQNETFQDLCSHLMKVARFLDPQEVISVYKVLAFVGVRNNSYVMQSVLKMIGAHLNNMTLGQLTFLNFLLSRQRQNALVDGLRMAIPLVLQAQIDQQLDSENLAEVASCLQIASKYRLKPAIIEKIVSTLLAKCALMTPDIALTVVFSLLNLETPVDGYKELSKVSFNIITENIEALSQKQIVKLIHLCRSKRYYNSKLLFACSRKIISEKWNLDFTYEVLNHLYSLNFAPPELLDHLAEVIYSEAELFKTDDHYSCLNCVEYFTATGYRPKGVDNAIEILCCDEKIEKLNEISPNLRLKFLSCMAMLGHFPRDYLSNIMDETFLHNAWSLSKKQGRAPDFEKSILALIWSLEVHDQADNFKFPVTVIKTINHSICQRHVVMNSGYPLKKFIETGLGGSQFLLSGIFSHDGHIIDHVLAMRSGNYPVALKTKTDNVTATPFQHFTFVEDIALPEDAKLIAVIVAHEDKYCKDPEVPNGWLDVKIKHLTKKGYAPVVIHFPTWNNLPDREKIPYIMQEIKQAVHEDDSLRNTLL